jgi:hypothetical protein
VGGGGGRAGGVGGGVWGLWVPIVGNVGPNNNTALSVLIIIYKNADHTIHYKDNIPNRCCLHIIPFIYIVFPFLKFCFNYFSSDLSNSVPGGWLILFYYLLQVTNIIRYLPSSVPEFCHDQNRNQNRDLALGSGIKRAQIWV